ncbi:class I SAM-dependent methyltransferase [Bradyrhizobium sp. ORS 375]|uniref:class I SAM-dependent methyltransferase n=1 Tax=Bradyrhizobium sp. (strain ORS 375) TaxID=566679 RepID=UPI0015859CAA|nr:class I SAM-dependent methyltransferase [Bradyrhizobium sp. ORS 375]
MSAPDYDASVDNWLEKEPEQGWVHQLIALGVSPGSRLLDCGCGGGKYARNLRRAGLDVIGMDRSAEALRLSDKNNNGEMPIVNARISSLPFKSGAFEYVLMRYVLHHISKSDYVTSFQGLYDIIRPSGALLIETSFHEDVLTHFDHQLYPPLGRIALEMYSEWKFTSSALSVAGFVVERCLPMFRKAGQFTSVYSALENSRRLVEQGRGPTTWLKLSEAQRSEFHNVRMLELARRFPDDRVPREWRGSLVLARKN